MENNRQIKNTELEQVTGGIDIDNACGVSGCEDTNKPEIIIPKGVTLDVEGSEGTEHIRGGSGIPVSSENTSIIVGEGTKIART